MDEWIKNIQYIHAVKYYSAMREKEILPFATIWVYRVGIILRKKKSDRDGQILYDITYMWNLKKPNSQKQCEFKSYLYNLSAI